MSNRITNKQYNQLKDYVFNNYRNIIIEFYDNSQSIIVLFDNINMNSMIDSSLLDIIDKVGLKVNNIMFGSYSMNLVNK